MKEYKYVTVEYKNNKLTTAESGTHREIIDKQAAEGYAFAGYIPCVMGPSGKILSIDLIFEKDV